jgi:hypothetical protein
MCCRFGLRVVALFWGVLEARWWGLAREVGGWGVTLGATPCLRPLPLSLLPGYHEVVSFAQPYALAAMMLCLHAGLQQWTKSTLN